MGNKKFGWHSGTMRCQDAKIQGDCYIQDDLVFSDVSAGVLGVTGGIDMTGTTSAIGISFTGGSFTTGAIMCGTSTSARQTMAEAEDFVLGIYTTCADTDGSNTAKPLYVNAQYTGVGQVARAAEFVLYPTAKLGGWANALKAYTDFSGDADGGSTGLVSSACLEMKLPNGACNGAFYPLEIEWVGQASTAFSTPGTGSASTPVIPEPLPYILPVTLKSPPTSNAFGILKIGACEPVPVNIVLLSVGDNCKTL